MFYHEQSVHQLLTDRELLELRVVLQHCGHQVEHPDQGVIRRGRVAALSPLVPGPVGDAVTKPQSQSLDVKQVHVFFAQLEVLHQLAKDPEVVTARRPERFLARLCLQDRVVDALTPRRLHGLGVLEVLEKDGEQGGDHPRPCPALAGRAQTEPVHPGAHLPPHSRVWVLQQKLLQPDADLALGKHHVLHLAAGVAIHPGYQEAHGKVDNLTPAKHPGPVAAAVLAVQEH